MTTRGQHLPRAQRLHPASRHRRGRGRLRHRATTPNPRLPRRCGRGHRHDHTLIGPVYADRFAGLPVVTTNHGPFQSELGDYYQALAEGTRIIAICLLNSIDWPEPFGMVMVEALAFGTPVMATHMGAAPEIVADGITGFIRSTQKDLSLGLSRHRKTSTAARVEPP